MNTTERKATTRAQRQAYIKAHTLPANAWPSAEREVAGSLVRFVKDKYGLDARNAVRAPKSGTWVICYLHPENGSEQWDSLERIERLYGTEVAA